MKTLQSKIIHFKIINNAKINFIMMNEGTLFVEARIYYEKDDNILPLYWGYYDMGWSSLDDEQISSIPNSLRTKILEMLSNTLYTESDAFELEENCTYDFSNIELYAIEKLSNNKPS